MDDLRALLEDRTSGGSELTRRAAEFVARLPDQEVVEACPALVRAHPAIVPLLHLASDALWMTERGEERGALAEARTARAEALADHAVTALDEAAEIVTYSRSGTVLGALARLGPRRVTLSEARPGDEGVGLAGDLAAAGIEVRLTVDAALPRFLAGADAVVVGADALCLDGVVNKTGTGLLAEAADEAGVPVLVLAGRDKEFPPVLGRRPRLTTQGSLDDPLPPGVEAHLPLFEAVAFERFDRVVQEDGVWPSDAFPDRLDQRLLHPALLALNAP